jgi:hypothetical protein
MRQFVTISALCRNASGLITSYAITLGELLMRRLLASILAGILLTYVLLFWLPMMSVGAKSFALTLLFLPEKISWKWVGLDCPNADYIADKLSCVGISLTVDVIAYSALFYLLFWLFGRAGRCTDKVAAA